MTHAGHSESVEASSSGNEVIRSPNVEDMQAEHEKSNEQTLPGLVHTTISLFFTGTKNVSFCG